jgi:hypothetical protein
VARRCGGWSVAPIDERDTSGQVVISHSDRWPHAAGTREALTMPIPELVENRRRSIAIALLELRRRNDG